MSEKKITLEIDGRRAEVAPGTTLLQAADAMGIPIPRYCFHPALPIAGNCRVCMVEVEGMPQTVIACNTQAMEGMVVRTASPMARASQRAVLEFLLANHPVDCPVCDQAGECYLQDYYMLYGRYASRMEDRKVLKRKAVPIGPHVILDQERCILCSRCVRFTTEISKTHQLGIVERGDRSAIVTPPGTELDDPYSGCTVDICPVGALTERDFRFQLRVWYLSREKSVCPRCSRGCNIEVHFNRDRPHKAQGRRVVRLKPRHNPEVNGWWMCDEGRFGFGAVDAPDRLRRPLVRKDTGRLETGWEAATAQAVEGLRAAVGAHGPDRVAVILSPWMTTEELYLARRLFREALGIENVGLRVPSIEPREGDDFLVTEDGSPNVKGAKWVGVEGGLGSSGTLKALAGGKLRALLLFRHDFMLAQRGVELLDACQKLDFFLYAGTNDNPTAERAHVVLPLAAWVEREGSWVNVDGRVQRFPRVLEPLGEALPDFEALRRLADAAGIAYPYRSPRDAFEALRREVKKLAAADWEEAGRLGRPWNANGLPEIPAAPGEGDEVPVV